VLDARITLHKLEVFEHVVELGGVNRAAEQLHVSQPVVTAHIRSLEARLGARLFYREGRHLQLTEAGRTVHAWAADVLRRTRELERHLENLSDGTRGTVVIGASMAVGGYMLPPVLAEFRHGHPLVVLRLNILDTEHAIADTLAGENDFSIVISETDPSGDLLRAEQLGVEEMVFVAAPDADVPARPLTVDELVTHSFVEAPHGLIRRTFVENALRRFGITERTIAIELGHPEAMKATVKAGLGIAVLSRTSVAGELERGTLREIEVQGVRLWAPVYVVTRADKVFGLVQVELIDAIRLALAPGADAAAAAGAPAPGAPVRRP
jgi:DNA-binding transcriptional LysR family regulator